MVGSCDASADLVVVQVVGKGFGDICVVLPCAGLGMMEDDECLTDGVDGLNLKLTGRLRM